MASFKIINLKDVIRVAPEVTRGFEGGPEGLELIAIGGNKRASEHTEASEDAWRRVLAFLGDRGTN